MSRAELYLADENSTVEFGKKLGESCQKHGVIYLLGDLGAGKTTLSRGVLLAYGYKEAVKSPTYTLVETYDFPAYQVYHFDLYRLEDGEELEYMGVRDYFTPDSLCLVEWPERGVGILPNCDLCVELQLEYPGRKVIWQGISDHGERIAKQLQDLTL